MHTSIEVFTGSVPFNLHLPTMVGLAIIRGDRPSRPTHRKFTDELWELTQCCWRQEPHLRPRMSAVTERLRGLSVPTSFHNQALTNLTILMSMVTSALPSARGRLPHPLTQTRTPVGRVEPQGEKVYPHQIT